MKISKVRPTINSALDYYLMYSNMFNRATEKRYTREQQEDLRQDWYRVLEKSAEKYDKTKGATLSSWLFTATKYFLHQIQHRLAKRYAFTPKAEITNPETKEVVDTFEDIISSDEDTESITDYTLRNDLILYYLKYLTEKQRKVICMYFGLCGYASHSTPELAKIFGTSHQNINQHIKFALKKLEKLMTRDKIDFKNFIIIGE